MSSSTAASRKGLPKRVRMRHNSHFVEELTARNETPVGKMVPLSAIEPDPNQPRSTMGDLTDLASSIKDKGVLEPILVRKARDAENGSQLIIISGERRYRAAMEAGLIEVPVIEMDVDEDEALEIALIENLQRKDLTPFEEADGYRSLAERFDYTHENIASAVGRSRTVVTESLALLQMPTRVQETAQALGIKTKSLLLEVLKADGEQEMIRLLEDVERRGLSRDDLRRQQRRGRTGEGAPQRRKPFVYSFRSPDKSFNLSLKFRQSQISKHDLIRTLEEILGNLRQAAE